MRAIIQRVSEASVTVDKTVTGSIKKGILVLAGMKGSDTDNDLEWMAGKIINLRIFEDEQGKMNLSLKDIEGEMLIVSQFTLYGDCRKGRRPGFSEAAPPDIAERLYLRFIDKIRAAGIATATGQFQADMKVQLINDGPVTLMLDTEKIF